MPTRTPCQRCQRVGLVRVENVIKAGQAKQVFYCGSCEHTWQVNHAGTSNRTRAQSPHESSRSE